MLSLHRENGCVKDIRTGKSARGRSRTAARKRVGGASLGREATREGVAERGFELAQGRQVDRAMTSRSAAL
jgi:hypothetical protein